MGIQLSVTARNDRLTGIGTAVGASPKLQIWSGSMPASCAAASTGTKLLEDTLGATPFSAASAGAMALASTPIAGTGAAGGTAGYFRLVDSSGNCHIQGTVTATGGGGDMTVDNTSIASGQTVNITGFTLTDGNA